MTVDYDAIHTLIREVPKGEVASYGMIASLIPGAGPRQTATALRSAPEGLPWFRIVTASGHMADHSGAEKQRRLLKSEDVAFKKNGAVDWFAHRWRGPSKGWVEQSGLDIETVMETIAGWGR
ncbi:MGMT family protein [Hyphococcus sp.]|uniref:MGMT family protein n=1 Tax=Hyphococcus sp. TaxID=2038636 RepID=UPI003CCB8DF5